MTPGSPACSGCPCVSEISFLWEDIGADHLPPGGRRCKGERGLTSPECTCGLMQGWESSLTLGPSLQRHDPPCPPAPAPLTWRWRRGQ